MKCQQISSQRNSLCQFFNSPFILLQKVIPSPTKPLVNVFINLAPESKISLQLAFCYAQKYKFDNILC